MIEMLIFQLWGTPLHCTSDRPCQLIIFPIEKSLHEFFFSNISGARIFFVCLFSLLDFYFCFCPTSPPPITFLMVRPLMEASSLHSMITHSDTEQRQCSHDSRIQYFIFL
jgi:hypothetical protein